MLSQPRHKNVLHVQKSVIFFTLINLKKKIKIKRVTRELTDQTHLLKLKVINASFFLFFLRGKGLNQTNFSSLKNITGDTCRLPKYRLAEFESNSKQLNGEKNKLK
jgi:hypothetical protein